MAPAETKYPSRGYLQLVQVRGILGQERRGQRGSEGHMQREVGRAEEGAGKDSVERLQGESPGVQGWNLITAPPHSLKMGPEVGCHVC